MAGKKGALAKVVEAVSDAVETVAMNVGLTPQPEPAHQPKAARKAERKVKVAQAEETKNLSGNSGCGVIG